MSSEREDSIIKPAWHAYSESLEIARDVFGFYRGKVYLSLDIKTGDDKRAPVDKIKAARVNLFDFLHMISQEGIVLDALTLAKGPLVDATVKEPITFQRGVPLFVMKFTDGKGDWLARSARRGVLKLRHRTLELEFAKGASGKEDYARIGEPSLFQLCHSALPKDAQKLLDDLNGKHPKSFTKSDLGKFFFPRDAGFKEGTTGFSKRIMDMESGSPIDRLARAVNVSLRPGVSYVSVDLAKTTQGILKEVNALEGDALVF